MSRIFVAACFAALASPLVAAAQDNLVTPTDWSAAPTAAQMAAAYPAKAKAAGVGGQATLVCTMGDAGMLRDCDVGAESPKGYGFGAAAHRLSESLRAANVARGVVVKIPVTFPAELAKGEAATLKSPVWTVLPTPEDLQGAMPKTPGGPNDIHVALICDVQAGGLLSGCAVAHEDPAGQGFGAAVLALADKFRVGLMSAEGMPAVGAKVRVPVHFELTPVAAPAKP